MKDPGMPIVEVYQPFEIQEIELERWRQRPVRNNFFELVLIKNGRGTQCINYNEYPYSEGSLFLLPPLNCHSFAIDSTTRFVFLKFTSAFFQSGPRNSSPHADWFREAAYILSNYNQMPGDIVDSELDRQHIHTLVDLILKENQNHGQGSVPLIRSLMIGILEILLRNIKRSPFYELAATAGGDERIPQLLAYINEHIAESDRLRVEHLAETFHLSPTYLSEFFRKNVHMPLREYIIKARLKLVEIRLLHSDYTLSEIAAELNFTDVSHLSKTFKRYAGMTMSEFRKEGEYRLLKRNSC